jgi:hypothetical protein
MPTCVSREVIPLKACRVAPLGQGNLMTGAIITWPIRLDDWIRDFTAAAVVLMEGSLWKVAQAIQISRAAVGLSKQN